MTQFNEQIKSIQIKEVLIVIILTSVLILCLKFFKFNFDGNLLYLVVILYFVFKLRDSFQEFKKDVSNVFSAVSFKEILIIVLLNILFSYGMLYLANFTLGLDYFNANNFGHFLSIVTNQGDLASWCSLFAIVFVSPVFEELVFRGVFLNKFRLVIPTALAILITSLLFAALHGFGSIFAAFVFGICISIFYLKSENIVVPVFAHFLNNLLGEVIFHLDSSEILFSNNFAMGIMSVLAIVSFILILRFIVSNIKNI